jgi:hypothetical protein
MSEVKAIETIDTALGALDPAERERVLEWAQKKFGGPFIPTVAHHPVSPSAQPVAHAPAASAPKAKPKAVTKKSKTILSMDKNLNLNPSGKASAAQFAADKSPTNVKEKCVVAAYYLRDVLEVEKVTAQGVLTFFKHLSWPVPSDLKNTLQQAGTAGWLDTSDSDDIKITSSGENLVEHDLPTKVKAK